MPAGDRDALRSECEASKLQLSEESQTLLTIKRLLGSAYPSVEFDRERLRSLVRPLLLDAFDVLEQALTRAGLDGASIDAVLPIGGSCNLVAVQEELEQRYPGKVYMPQHPQWMVAQGASRLADRLAQRPRGGVAQLDQTIALRLADDSYMLLVQPGQAFGGEADRHLLGIVEDTTAAQLVFAQAPGRDFYRSQNIGCLSVPMQGFVQERLWVLSQLTPDLTFKATAYSDTANRFDHREFEYDQLQFVYDLR